MFKPKLGSKGTSKCSQGSTFSLYPSWVAHDGRILKRNSRVCVCVLIGSIFHDVDGFFHHRPSPAWWLETFWHWPGAIPPFMGMYLRSTHLEMDKPGIISIIKQIQSCLEPNCCKTFFGQFGTHPPILVCNGVSIFLVILCRWCSWRCHRDLLTTSPRQFHDPAGQGSEFRLLLSQPGALGGAWTAGVFSATWHEGFFNLARAGVGKQSDMDHQPQEWIVHDNYAEEENRSVHFG